MPEPTHLATINVLLATIDGQPYSAANDRLREVLEILRDILATQAATDERLAELEQTDTDQDESTAIHAKILAIFDRRLAELEAWRETQTGDGK